MQSRLFHFSRGTKCRGYSPCLGPVPNPAAPEPCDYPFAFAVPVEAINEGYNLIEAQTENRRDITWAEIAFSDVA